MVKNYFKYIIFFILLNYSVVSSQTIGSAYLSCIRNSTGLTSISNLEYTQNPSQLCFIDSQVVSIAISPSRFQMKELTPAFAFYAQPITDNLKSGISITGLGNNLFNEFSGMLLSSYKFGDNTFLGASIVYSRIAIKDFQINNAFQVNIGGIINISDDFSTGFAITNLTREHYFGGENTINQDASFGVGYKALENLSFGLDGIIALSKASGLALSGKYNIENLIDVKIAYLTNPIEFEAGLNIIVNKYFDITVYFQYHNLLGISQIYSISFKL